MSPNMMVSLDFYVTSSTRDSNGNQQYDPDQEWIFGISADSVYKLVIEDNTGRDRIESSWDFSKVTRWRYDEPSHVFIIDLTSNPPTLDFTVSPEDGSVIGELLCHYLEVYQSNKGNSNTGARTEAEIEVKVFGQSETTVFAVKVSDPISTICNNIAKYFKFECDGRYGLRPLSKNTFLYPYKALNQQDVDFYEVFVFATRLFIPTPPISRQGDYLNFLFAESHQFILEGRWMTTKDQSIKLAALETQFRHGDHNQRVHNNNFFSQNQLQKILPKEWQQTQNITEIMKEHKRLIGVPPSDACFRYIEAVRKLPSYGDTFFTIQTDKYDDVLSVNAGSICHITGDTGKLLTEWVLTDIRSCTVDPKGVTLSIDYSDGGSFSCNTKDALGIERLILDYMDFESKKKAKPAVQQKQEDTCSVM